MNKKIILLLLIFFIQHCGFSPIYTKNSQTNYFINLVEINGDRIINDILNSEIKRISNSQAENKIILKINTSFEKNILSKDMKGSTSDFRVILNANFSVEQNGIKDEITFQEKHNVKNLSDIFEQKNYEETLKRNFALSTIRKFNLELNSRQ